MYIPEQGAPVARLNPPDCRLRRRRWGVLARSRLALVSRGGSCCVAAWRGTLCRLDTSASVLAKSVGSGSGRNVRRATPLLNPWSP